MDKINTFDNYTKSEALNTYKLMKHCGINSLSELLNTIRMDLNTLILITKGRGTLEIDSHLYHFSENDLFVLSPYQKYRFNSCKNIDGLVVVFDEINFYTSNNLDCNFDISYKLRNINIIRDISSHIAGDIHRLYEENNSGTDSVSPLIQKNLLQNILYKTIMRADKTMETGGARLDLNTYDKFIRLVEVEFRKKHNVNHYTSKLGISTKKINHSCQRVKGVSAKQIIDKRLVSELKDLLSHTSSPISEIASELGFDEPTNLSKYFKKHTGMSPSQYRSLSKSFYKVYEKAKTYKYAPAMPQLAVA